MKRKLYLTAMLCLMMAISGGIYAQTVMGRPSIYQPLPSPFADKVNVKTEWRGEQLDSRLLLDGMKKAPGGGLSGPTHQVQIVIECNETTQPPFEMNFRNTNHDTKYSYYRIYPLKAGIATYEVPEGTFDIVAVFSQLNEEATALTGVLTVIREQVPIFSDTTLTFAADEAKNHITFQTYTIDGEPMNTGLYHQNEDGSWTCLEEGNVEDVIYYNYISCKDYAGVLESPGSNYFGVRLDTQTFDKPLGEINSGFYVNDVSERIVFNSNRIATKQYNFFTSNYEVQGASGDTIVSNEPSEYKLYSDSFEGGKLHDTETKAYLEFWIERPGDAGGYYTSFNFNNPMQESDAINLYLGASPDKSCLLYAPSIVAGRCYQSGEYPWGEPMVSFTILSPTLTNINGNAAIASNGASGRYGTELIWDYSEIVGLDGDRAQIPVYPTHPIFTYPVEMKKGEFGKNCPFIMGQVSIQDMTAYGGPIVFDCAATPTGRFGEVIFKCKKNMTLKQNDEIIYTSSTQSYAELEEALHGDIDAELIIDDVYVDDLPATNVCNIHINADATDSSAPSLTNFQLKDEEGYITERFEDSQDGIIEFMAGDFGFANTPMGYVYYTRFQPATVEVSYSPYQANEWNELAVEEVPEYYWPLLGWFYQGSLASVNRESENGWFDLKFRLVDESGNWQEQTLSPAFRIDALVQSAVSEVRDGSAHEVARYSIDGKRVDTSHHGVTIIRMSDGTARKVIL